MKERFSKAALDQYLTDRIEQMQGFYGFDPDGGSAQVAGCEQNKILAYSRYASLRVILADLRGGYIVSSAGEKK